jgi:Helix-turn-helix.
MNRLSEKETNIFINNLKKYKNFYKINFDELASRLGMSRSFFSITLYKGSKPYKNSIKKIAAKSNIDYDSWINEGFTLTNLPYNKLSDEFSEKEIGERVKYIRRTCDSIEDFSKKTGISVPRINLMEKGKQINFENIFKICKTLNINVDYMFGLSLSRYYIYENKNIDLNVDNLKKIISKRKISLKNLLDDIKTIYNINIDKTTVFKWINYKRKKINISLLFYICKILNCSLNEVLDIEDKSVEEEKFKTQRLIYELKDINEKLDIVINNFIFGDYI